MIILFTIVEVIDVEESNGIKGIEGIEGIEEGKTTITLFVIGEWYRISSIINTKYNNKTLSSIRNINRK